MSYFISHQSQYHRAVDVGDLRRILYEETGIDINVDHCNKGDKHLMLICFEKIIFKLIDALTTIRNVLNQSCVEDRGSVVVVCGTGYIMSVALEALRINELR